MLLSDVEIRSEITEGRLQFDPSPAAGAIQSASIDLSLSRKFWRPNVPGGPGVELVVDIGTAKAYQYLEEEESDQIRLAPNDFIIGETAEGVSMPQHLAGWIEGKSGLARHGLIVHCTAPHIAPGWGRMKPNPITLEIVNLGKVTNVLRAGIGIAQLLVMRLGSPSADQYAGQYGEMLDQPKH
ncbi:MAG: dCTP deaminase [Actinomycetota bacterium]|jgi:dCTP deaminase|nr:dCTP deaminase [Actinomycetota bacterium]